MLNLNEKICCTCKKVKEKKEFHADNATLDGKHSRCKVCKNIASKEYAKNNPEKLKAKEFKRGLKRFYGISVEQYDEMFIKQNGCCEICKTHQSLLVRRLAVDHSHETNEIRGLLCDNCNPMLGYAKESIERLTQAIAYLTKFKK